MPLHGLNSQSLVPRSPVRVRGSQSVLHIRLTHEPKAVGSFLVDGKRWPRRVDSSTTTSMRLPIDGDLEAHTILCAWGGTHLLNLDIEACVYREFDAGGKKFMLAKWTVWQGRVAIELSREIVPRTSSARSELDVFDRALTRQGGSKADTAQALHLAAWSLGALVAALRPKDIEADYAVQEESDIDVEATRESLRRNMDWLQPRADGQIRIRDRRFSTARVERQVTDTARLDLSVPLLACDVALRKLGESQDAVGAGHMLATTRRRLAILSGARTGLPSAASIRFWREREPLTPHSLRLRNGLLRVLALSRDMVRAESRGEGGKGLIPGFLDHRLFETWCWVKLYEALGGNQADLRGWVEPPSSLRLGGTELVATGHPGGRNRFSELLARIMQPMLADVA